MSIVILLLIVIIVLFGVRNIRMQFITRPVFTFFKKVLPPLSTTEKEAMEAGDVWWEGELFRGKPNWNTLHGYGKPTLTAEEQDFIDNQVQTALTMIDDFDIVHNRKDLPPELWQYFKEQGFFALIIPKKYGGREFSAYANSTIVAKIATRSVSAAVTVMVPNSLGPGELLTHYGTQEQKERWLPSLAVGKDIPCFALTGPEAGSDAGAIPDLGIVCRREFEGEETLGLSLTWNKRYITLAPVATVLGLAFQMRDPDGLLGDVKNLGITCALIPTDHEGVEIGRRHNPLMMAFMNGTTSGEDVFIPLDWIIGGPQYAGKGWRMLVECLSAGRGISLPALATASGHVSTKTTTAYSYVRQQFGMPIGNFEGVQEAMARIIANTYQLEAARRLTTQGIDLKVKPSVVTAIAKYHMTELGRDVLEDAMDIQSGKGIQLGPKNYLGHAFMANPISITVEGANILTRSLMIFGQGATRCHPYVLAEMEAAAMEDETSALDRFDSLLLGHMGYAIGNALRSLGSALTGSRFASAPVSGPTQQYYRDMTRISSALAIMTDLSMLIMGGDLKRKEMISARMGDVLSQLYLASATLKLFEDNGRQQDDLPAVHYAMTERLHLAAKALEDAIRNFPSKIAGVLLRVLIFPLGNHFNAPSDKSAVDVCKGMLKPGPARNRITFLCGEFEGDTSGIAEVENAFLAKYAAKDLYKKLKKAQRSGHLKSKLPMLELFDVALEKDIITQAEHQQLLEADELRLAAINVNDFEKL
ncbi:MULTISPECIES: acyl-CoA dehydrogenase [Shewanella]|uniref:Acyl-coenzyme A dehydrogenase n=2 Tax=Shewanella TaxID=22 RepID=A0A9X1Z5T5_9GAMM|nr:MULTISPECIES: acyl-CoA dehydrogenase [Shewanella]MCL1102118.1 acyl-CoA dehydrogenase [Shewanella saliphila]MCL1104294.1 acyl-CoA dehydrogenase [Shewanella algicola]GGP43144.1 acyl-CoA dehydrogenase [Shewanella algicola]GGP58268.1 acyl-CoA dehydrogenase [Shewanella saliphila]